MPNRRSQLTYFAVRWGIAGCHIDGPFGDDAEAAREYIRTALKDPDDGTDGCADAGGIFAVELEEVDVPDSQQATLSRDAATSTGMYDHDDVN